MPSTFLLLPTLLLAALHSAQCHTPANTAACASDHCQVQLSPDLTMRYRIHLPDDYHSESHTNNESSSCEECKLSVQLLYNGFSWLGIGLNSKGKMVGGHAVIGQPGIAEPRDYYLDGKDIDYITPTTNVLEDHMIEFIDGQTIMEFTTSFSNWGIQSPMGVSLNNLYTFIWAHGNEGGAALSYHGPNSKSSYTIDNLMGFSSDSSTTQQGLNSMTSLQQAASTKAAWLAHGIMAFIAFGVLLPLAITTAILRDCDAVPPFCKGLASKISERWLYIHIGLNSFTYLFTVVVFSVAVTTINRERYSHWEHAHSKMGLAIFILASFQVLGGYFRPSSATTLPTSNVDNTTKDPAEETGGEGGMTNENNSIGEVKAMPVKSTLRQMWELLHHILGIALFFFGMWQMYEGIELYHARYVHSRRSSVTIAGFYIVWMALWTIVIIGGTLYKWFFQSRDRHDDGDSREGREQPGDVVVINDTQELS